MSVLDLSNIVCVVTQVIVPVLNGASSLLETLTELGINEERIWVILNRAHRSFPGELRRADVEAHLGMNVRHEIAFDKRLPMATNMGRPQVLHSSPFNKFRRSIRRVVDDIDTSSTASSAPTPDVNPTAPPLRVEEADRRRRYNSAPSRCR